jgi:hypothetical protein
MLKAVCNIKTSTIKDKFYIVNEDNNEIIFSQEYNLLDILEYTDFLDMIHLYNCKEINLYGNMKYIKHHKQRIQSDLDDRYGKNSIVVTASEVNK